MKTRMTIYFSTVQARWGAVLIITAFHHKTLLCVKMAVQTKFTAPELLYYASAFWIHLDLVIL